MEWWHIGILMFSSLFLLLILGIPVAFGLVTVSFMVILFSWGPGGLLTLAANTFSSLTNYLLLAAPLFIFMGISIEVSGLAEDAFKAIENWLGRVRGSLAICTVTAATIFGAATGFSGTGSAAFGPVVLPEMARRKYDPGLALGAMGGGSALGVLIPPSVPLLMFGFLSGESISKLFLAGVIPGIVGSLIFMTYISIRTRFNPSLAPLGQVATWREALLNTWRILPLFMLILLVLGSLWGGMATPTEAAAFGAFGAFLMVIFYGRFSWHTLKHIMIRTVEINAMVFAIIIGAFAFTQMLSYTGFVTKFSALVANLPVSPWLIIALMMAVNIFLGCFLDTMAIFFLTLPIYLPVVNTLGYDLIWFAILMTINSEIGALTPPVGIGLYILKGVAPKEWSFSMAIRGITPYVFLYLLLMILVGVIPQIALWLPKHM